MATTATNKFGRLADLRNEATVEQFFVNRLLRDLGYKDADIKPKSSLDELTLNLGHRRVKYRPDYALLLDKRVRWICEAKGPEESLDDWVGQCTNYCLELNRGHQDNPVEYFMLTNGVTTRLYRWDQAEFLAEANFHHFVDGNQCYGRMRALLDPMSLRRAAESAPGGGKRLVLRRRTVSDLNTDFAWAHRLIYRRENLSYTAAFMEFVKLIFLKLLSDRRVHDSPHVVDEDGQVSVPAEEVRFSRQWIESHEHDAPNPLDAILFQCLLGEFETEIREGTKKRIFDQGERLNLSADTIKVLADRFEGVDLISIDADLNGRMFETFLNSTLRGKALGQYFTPRSVVKLATGLARLRATPDHVDKVIDACCGTGGFLIEALAVMWAQIDANPALSNTEREDLRTVVSTSSLFGIDVARDPALARIARINMYLHGDGGSSIYQFDALDKQIRKISTDEAEIQREKSELRSRLSAAGAAGFADVALTNPPFAKDYSRNLTAEGQLLDDYELAFDGTAGARRPLSTLSSMVMFLERYLDLLKPGGRLVTVVDDSLLGSVRHRQLRTWIRRRWIVRAVVSLPGDAFQRSQARVKTSVLVLEKRVSAHQDQPSVFMYYCTAVGVDDAPRQRVLPVDEANRQAAQREIARVSALFDAFHNGRSEAVSWTVPAEAISDRMDVKACLAQPSRRVAEWRDVGLNVVALGDLIAPVALNASSPDKPGRVIDPDTADDELVTYLRVRYDGCTESGDEVWTSDVGCRRLIRVRQGDIVLSHINALHGAVGVVPTEHAGHVVTAEYTVCRANDGVDPLVVCALVRSPEARADLLLLATGIGRTRIQWAEARNLLLPEPTPELNEEIVARLARADQADREGQALRRDTRRLVEEQLRLDSPTARAIIAAFKPPR
jgi:type I restriction enzyme M protein